MTPARRRSHDLARPDQDGTLFRAYMANDCAYCDSLVGQFYLSQILVEAEDEIDDLDDGLQRFLLVANGAFAAAATLSR